MCHSKNRTHRLQREFLPLAELRDAEDPRRDGRQRGLHECATRKTGLIVSNGSFFPSLSSETQRILDGKDDSAAYMNVTLEKQDSSSPSGDEPDVSYVEIHFKTLSVPRVRTGGDGLTSTYSVLNLRNDEIRIDDYEDPPSASGPAELSVTAQAAAHEQESNVKIGNRPHRLICLLCLVTSALIVIVAGFSIHVSQIRQSKIISDRSYNELNSDLQSKLSALNSNLSDLNRMHSDLRHQFTEMETKYRSVNQAKVQICELLTSRREQKCPQNWIENDVRCYFISTLEKSYDGARHHCSNIDARLLEINSNQEKEFVSTSIGYAYRTYWIGKCRDGNVVSYLLYKMYYGSPSCSKCGSSSRSYSCNSKYRFICEKSAHLYPDIPEEIQALCQQPVGPNTIN
ncbi:uncharacterized protein [Hemitrygon akajei]|uniref:uncharacterized protein n=1 Tax=Hemitrygon akajei TaxID=2704970 RepID=UPI003BF9E5EA